MPHHYAELSYRLKRDCVRYVRDHLMPDFAASPAGERYSSRFLEQYDRDDSEVDLERVEFEYFSALDHFILFEETKKGQRVIDILMRRENITQEERDVLAEWKDKALETVFEIKEVTDEKMRLFDVVAETDYDVYANQSVPITGFFPKDSIGHFLGTALMPIKGVWFMSGMQRLYPPESERAIFDQYVQKVRPRDLYRNNPEKLKKAFELQKAHYDCFVKCFGTDEVLAEGREIAAKEKQYYDFWYRERNLPGSFTPGPYDVELLNAADVGMVMDEKEGLHHFIDYGKFTRIFSAYPKRPRGWKGLVRGYLDDETVPAFVFRMMRDKHPAAFKAVIAAAVKYPIRPGFDPVNHFDELIDSYRHDWRDVYPSTHPLNERFRKYYYQRRPDGKKVGRNDPCPCQSGKKFKKCCAR